MGRLGNISGAEAVRAFERAGWRKAGQVGSHVVLVRHGNPANLSIPQHRELGTGLLLRQIKRAGLTVDEFLELRRK
ncbi:MAG: type II toxin-antitoxin system HicA family toxin [Dehalococcoidia bacterium]|nr:type II toxin-antitoxin system HicA family toxin [Dehalococcoidia bacterium]